MGYRGLGGLGFRLEVLGFIGFYEVFVDLEFRVLGCLISVLMRFCQVVEGG